MAATEELLGLLHEALASDLLAQVKKAREAEEALSPQLIAQVIKFLKDNGIEAVATENETMNKLADQLPDFDNEEGLYARH